MTAYWEEHQVGGPYADINGSRQALAARQELFPKLLQLMPVDRYWDKTVLDYGCGPGHDTLLFSYNGAAVFFTDSSPLALQITNQRLSMHDLYAVEVDPHDLPEVAHVHCAGVLHHTEQPLEILRELREVCGEDANIMVYDGDLSFHSQSEVPITRWWTHTEFQALCRSAGFKAEYLDSYECSAPWRPDCYAACYHLT